MSRIRSVHPGFFTDEAFVSISMSARLLFIGLGIEADDKGIFEWKPLTIKMRLFPADNVDISAILAELEKVDVIRSYQIDGRSYGAIRNFRVFQRPKNPNDIHPITDDLRTYVGSAKPNSETGSYEPRPFPPKGEKPPQMEDGGWRMEDGEERGGGEARKRACAIPPGFVPVLTSSAQEIADRIGVRRYASELQRFKDHHQAKGSTMKDWQAAWRTWLSRCEDYGKGGGNGGGRPSGWLS